MGWVQAVAQRRSFVWYMRGLGLGVCAGATFGPERFTTTSAVITIIGSVLGGVFMLWPEPRFHGETPGGEP